jgi:hypothetical protein
MEFSLCRLADLQLLLLLPSTLYRNIRHIRPTKFVRGLQKPLRTLLFRPKRTFCHRIEINCFDLNCIRLRFVKHYRKTFRQTVTLCKNSQMVYSILGAERFIFENRFLHKFTLSVRSRQPSYSPCFPKQFMNNSEGSFPDNYCLIK